MVLNVEPFLLLHYFDNGVEIFLPSLDQRIASEETPLPVHMGSHKTINPPWDQATIGELDDEWKFMGGLTNSLYSDVVYEPVVLKKGIPVLVKMYFKDGLFNYTKNNPLSFYVEGN